MNKDKPIEVQHVRDLPPEVRTPVMRDAAEFQKLYKQRGSEWLCETMALFKYQVEGAHVRLDEMKEMCMAVMHQMRNLPRLDISMDDSEDSSSDAFGEDPDWWKR